MGTIRRHLLAIVSLWLVSQLGVVSAGSVLLAAGWAAKEGAVCTCAEDAGPGHYCPMHGTHGMADHQGEAKADAVPGVRDCALSSGTPASNIALSSLLAGIGPVPEAQESRVTLRDSERIALIPDFTLSQPRLPDSPPPR